MSKVGRLPITLPDGVQVGIEGKAVTVTGQKGTLTHTLPRELSLVCEQNVCTIQIVHASSRAAALSGLHRSIIANAVKGVSEGWSKTLEIQGTGFRAAMEGANLVLRVGYSHPISFPSPQNITILTKGNKVVVGGIDKQLVGEVSSQIRALKKPDRYKGKGIRYEGEVIRLKPGKKAKTA